MLSERKNTPRHTCYVMSSMCNVGLTRPGSFLSFVVRKWCSHTNFGPCVFVVSGGAFHNDLDQLRVVGLTISAFNTTPPNNEWGMEHIGTGTEQRTHGGCCSVDIVDDVRRFSSRMSGENVFKFFL